MEKDKKKTFFIRQPEYAGGPKALAKFLYENLRYPAEAIETGKEGTVMVEYDIDHQGDVVATRVLQGLGAAFDDEACRVVRLLKFDVPKNRGVRVLFHKKARIQFKKPEQKLTSPAQEQMQVSYTVTYSQPVEKPEEKEEKKEEIYSYTIQF